MKHYKTHKQGFTFIETLIAITVLLVAVVAPMSLAQDGVRAAKLAQDQIVAFYLAQEGVEVVRNMRDENRLAGATQLAGPLSSCIVDPDNSLDVGCTIDATQISGGTFDVDACPSGGCPPIRKDDERYTYRSGGSYIDTKYTREIRVWYTESPDTKDATVEVIVTWPFITSTRTYSLRANLLDW